MNIKLVAKRRSGILRRQYVKRPRYGTLRYFNSVEHAVERFNRINGRDEPVDFWLRRFEFIECQMPKVKPPLVKAI